MTKPESLVAPEAGERLANPFAAPVGPTAIVIFGASGDLTRRKLLPSLHNLAAANLLDDGIAIIGLGRGESGDEEFRQKTSEDLKTFATGDVDARAAAWLVSRARFLTGDFGDLATFQKLAELLARYRAAPVRAAEESRRSAAPAATSSSTSPRRPSSSRRSSRASGPRDS